MLIFCNNLLILRLFTFKYKCANIIIENIRGVIVFLKSKKIIALLLSLLIIFGMFCSVSAFAISVKCSDYKGSNINKNNYNNFADTVKSHLYKIDDNSLLRFQADVIKDKYYVEYYDATLKLNKSLTVDKELQIFGGFFADNDYYYILSGQKNPNEKADIEAFRVTKYDKSFKKLGSVGLYDCNTVIPFDAGSARFAKSGKNLIIRTTHQMYKSSDGKNHQANVTIQLDTENMSIEVSKTDVSNTGLGYVSHSFNQFVTIENDKLLAVDHGDAYPRSVALFLYHSPLSTGDFLSQGCEMREFITFPGDIGDNYTGASVGGFEYSDSSYIVAYNSVMQDSNFKNNTSRDIYIGVIDKSNKSLKTNRITTANANESFSTPHLVKISESEFLLLWSKDNSISYVKLDSKGNIKGNVYTKENVNLSDCKPIVFGNKIIWYEYTDAVCKFHSIDISNADVLNTVTVDNGHSFKVSKYPTAIGGTCKLICEKCSETKEISTKSDFSVLWSNDINGKFTSNINKIDVGQKFFYKLGNLELNDVEINLSDPQNILNDGDGFIFKKQGSYIITFTYKYNPNIKKAFKIDVSHTDVNCDKKCDFCGLASEPTHFFDNDCDEICNNCGTQREAVHNFNTAIKISDEQHSFKCSCGEVSEPQNHTFKKSGSNKYICSVCSFEISKTMYDNTLSNNSTSSATSQNTDLDDDKIFNTSSNMNSSSDTAQNNNSTSKELNVTIIAILISFVFLVFIGFLLWYFLFYKKKKQSI